ncbi:MAG: hypothetical protein HC767_07205 [Akkermansiaceae bacterium]|nr:hypothetical protein [Akkermansiaceae bacterium]
MSPSRFERRPVTRRTATPAQATSATTAATAIAAMAPPLRPEDFELEESEPPFKFEFEFSVEPEVAAGLEETGEVAFAT